MKCKSCGSERVVVRDSKKFDNCVIRSRLCLDCYHVAGSVEEWQQDKQSRVINNQNLAGR
jgi:transcriptional regulator NrdR family protein